MCKGKEWPMGHCIKFCTEVSCGFRVANVANSSPDPKLLPFLSDSFVQGWPSLRQRQRGKCWQMSLGMVWVQTLLHSPVAESGEGLGRQWLGGRSVQKQGRTLELWCFQDSTCNHGRKGIVPGSVVIPKKKKTGLIKKMLPMNSIRVASDAASDT